jgi:hypothetical protein
MKLNGIFRIENVEWTNPELTILVDGIELFPNSKTINVTVKLSKNGINQGVRLENVAVKNFNYNENDLSERILAHLSNMIVLNE